MTLEADGELQTTTLDIEDGKISAIYVVRNPDKPLARALAKPGHELQHRVATAEPTQAQIEVAEAALAAFAAQDA